MKLKSKVKRIAVGCLFAMGFLFFWLVVTFDIPSYGFESSDRGFASIESEKARPFSGTLYEFKRYKEWKHDDSITLCRTCVKPWWNPWEWHGLLTNPRWQYPYLSPSDKPQTNREFIEWHREQLRMERQPASIANSIGDKP